MARPDRDEPYTLDHLVADHRRQTCFLAALLILAILVFALRSILRHGASGPDRGGGVAPVLTRSR